MTTIECTKQEFFTAVGQFRKAMCSTESDQEGIGNMHKGLVLHYMGMKDVTDKDVEDCAFILEATTSEALRRGWDLIVPDLSGEVAA